MEKTRGTALGRPVSADKWAQIKEGERVSYAMAQPAQLSWKDSAPYTCPELQHRSQGEIHPSVIAGKPVYR